MGDRAWFVRLYGEIIDRTGAQTMLYLTCTTITSVDLAHYGASRAKNWVSVDCGTILNGWLAILHPYQQYFSHNRRRASDNERLSALDPGLRLKISPSELEPGTYLTY